MTFTWQKFNISVAAILSAMIMMLVGVGCENGGEGNGNSPLTVGWEGSSTVRGEEKGQIPLLIKGSSKTSYTATVESEGDWVSFNLFDFQNGKTTSGKHSGSTTYLYIYYKANSTSDSRKATITITFPSDSEPHTYTLTQLENGSTDDPNMWAKTWAELPAKRESSAYVYRTHTTRLNSGSAARNFSICYDKTLRVAQWVAYPLHEAYRGGTDRTNAWAYDPDVESAYQPDLTYSYRGANGESYDRGHQLPSADRTANTDMNAQTFYFSNMTPQVSQFNQNPWAALESKVRSYMCSDTLYVVTGAYFASTSRYTTDRSGNKCPVPTHYYKVLLRTVSGNTKKKVADCTESELKATGFLVENKYSGASTTLSSEWCVSVEEIEKMTGFEFFPQIPQSVKQKREPEKWGF